MIEACDASLNNTQTAKGTTSYVDERVNNLSAKAMVCPKEFVSVCLLITILLAFTSARKEKGKIGYILIHYTG